MIGSLRQRFAIILLVVSLVIWVFSLLIAALSAQQLLLRQVDVHLEQYANMAQHAMLTVLTDPVIQQRFKAKAQPISHGQQLTRVKSFDLSQNSNAVNLWFGDSQILVGEFSPQFPLPVAEGYVTRQLDGGSEWRLLYRQSPEYGVWQAVGINLASARQGAIETFWRGVLPLLIVLPLSIGLLLMAIRRGLQPLNQLAEQIADRKPQTLEPIPLHGVPQEITPIVVALNGLLDRLQRALTSEQRFTSNAAHELQTPLAAIQVAVQHCQRQLVSQPSEVGLTLQRISTRVSGAGDMVKQLLTLARLDPDQEFDHQSMEFGQLIIDVMADVGGIAVERGVTLQLDSPVPGWIAGNPDWLRILLRNLFVNAFRYSPTGGEVVVALESLAAGYQLVISNDCEPIREEEFSRLTERFYHPSSGGSHGVGLGLSIVLRIIELHGGSLQLSSSQSGRGFRAAVFLPHGR